MKIVYRRMEIRNFMSYSEADFDFTEQNGMNIITGINNDIPGSRNACGKSSLCHALVYALFGDLPFKLGKTHIYNRYTNSKNMRVTLWFDIDKKHYKVESGQKGGSYFHLFEINRGNENELTKSTIAETRAMFERDILRQDKNLFMRTVLLNSDPNYNFYNLEKSPREEFISKLFDIGDFKLIYNAIHHDIIELNKDINLREGGLMTYQKNKGEYEKRKVQWDENRSKNIAELELQITQLQKQLEEKTSIVVTKDNKRIEEFRKFADAAQKKFDECGLECRKATIEENGLRDGIKRLNSHIADRQTIIDKHSELLSKLCDKCKPIMSCHYNLDKYREEILKINAKIAADTSKLKKLSEKTAENRKIMTKIGENREKALRKISELSLEFDRNQKEIKELESTVSKVVSKLEELKGMRNPYEELIATNDRNIEDTNAEIAKLISHHKNLSACETMVSQDTIKKLVIKDLVGTLNAKIKHYLHRLGANYDIIFDDEMNHEFVTQNGMTAEFHNFSSGEQARISIATCLAFRDFLSLRSGISSNIFILDEFIDSNIDTMAIDNIVEILKEFSKQEKQNIFVISHRNEVSTNDAFNRIIQVEKTDNLSRIKYIDNRR